MVCLDCNRIFNRKRGGRLQDCPDCRSVNTQRAGSTVVSEDPPTPATKQATGTPPRPPKMPLSTPGARATGGGAITAEMLQLQKTRLNKVVKIHKRPGGLSPSGSQTAWGIRVVACQVEGTLIHGARWCAQISTRSVNDTFYSAPIPVNLSLPLRKISEGAVNNTHGNFNTPYFNRSAHLPSGQQVKINRRGAEYLAGPRIQYLEYGWGVTVAARSHWYKKRGAQWVGATDQEKREIEYYLGAPFRRYSLNCQRLVIAETGEVFYTPDHYETFYRYSPMSKNWHQYRSAEVDSGRGARWDNSFYD